MTGLGPSIEHHIVNTLGWPGLRPLQSASVSPVRHGHDCVLVAPTAGGKTEAALFPLLSEMETEKWPATSVIYVTPLKALLNNLEPRITSYAEWLGRQAAVRHGDLPQSDRRRILSDPPDVLLTTPESLESMLVSPAVDHHRFFRNVRAVVIDELHSFAGSDRGWHLLGVLERIETIAGRAVQRIGLSATVGNPHEVGKWMQGSAVGGRSPLKVVQPAAEGPVVQADVQLDFVGGIDNAAAVIARLHRGEKRLVFAESRRNAEELAYRLRELNVTTFVSHSSLSAEERRRSERAFADSKNTVIVATSTLELGVDIGDLDRVIQLDAPRTVASFLQRLGRTGRRPGSTRNMLFLATDFEGLLGAQALLLLWERGFVEEVEPPPHPRHLAAQQLMALALQEGAFGRSSWRKWWGDMVLTEQADEILKHLEERQFLVSDNNLLSIGPKAEKEFGRRHFMDLLASFTTDMELKVVAGTVDIGFISPLSITQRSDSEPDLLVLAGRGWRIKSVDWDRFTVWVEEVRLPGRSRWASGSPTESYELAQAKRQVLLGADCGVIVSKRVPEAMVRLREKWASTVDVLGPVVDETEKGRRVYTWAGLKANSTLLAGLGLTSAGASNWWLDLPPQIEPEALAEVELASVPQVPPEAMASLKFNIALSEELAARTLGERLADCEGARKAQADLIVRAL